MKGASVAGTVVAPVSGRGFSVLTLIVRGADSAVASVVAFAGRASCDGEGTPVIRVGWISEASEAAVVTDTSVVNNDWPVGSGESNQ